VILCRITDRSNTPDVLAAIRESMAAGVTWIQIREKDLPARELARLVQRVLALPQRRETRILVNTRVDVALATGADGAHLPAGLPPPHVWRPIAPAGFLIGVSCHTVAEVRAAEQEGANYVVFGPVFAPLSKRSDLEPRGLAGLSAAAGSVTIPVLALGGITRHNLEACLEAGAAGVAGISFFKTC
jgi:thiamine-phosphate pyrophosphorylase